MKKYLLSVLSLLFFTFLQGQTNDKLAIANGHLEKNQLAEAINIFLELEESGLVSLELYYNLGNTYLNKDSIALAILYYERAIKISPNDSDVINNLNIAKDRMEEQLTLLPDFFLIEHWNNVANFLQPNSWAYLSIIVGLGIVGLVFFNLYRGGIENIKLRVGSYALTIGLFTLIMAAGYSSKYKAENQNASIVMKEIFLKSGPDERSDDVKRIYPGYKLYLLDQLNGWTKVRTTDREIGWILPDNYVII